MGLGALGFWIFLAAVVLGGIWYGIRERQAQHETLRRMIDSDRPLDEALLRRLLGDAGGLPRDLKLAALILLPIAPGLALLGWMLGGRYPDSLIPMLGAALLTGCVAVGLLLASRMLGRS
jgi:hypothetical protein